MLFRSIAILYGDGMGGFPRRRDLGGAVAGNVILTDFNGDGLTDIVTGTGDGSVLAGGFVAVLPQERNGSYVASPVTLVPGFSTPAGSSVGIAAADFNGDGIPDLAFASGPYGSLPSGNQLIILTGNGDLASGPVLSWTWVRVSQITLCMVS